jgi:hypothetical protein
MKIVKVSSGQKNLVLSRSDWENIGRRGGWLKQAMPVLEPRWVSKESPKDWLFNIEINETLKDGTIQVVFAPKRNKLGVDFDVFPTLKLSRNEKMMLTTSLKKVIVPMGGEIMENSYTPGDPGFSFIVWFPRDGGYKPLTPKEIKTMTDEELYAREPLQRKRDYISQTKVQKRFSEIRKKLIDLGFLYDQSVNLLEE